MKREIDGMQITTSEIIATAGLSLGVLFSSIGIISYFVKAFFRNLEEKITLINSNIEAIYKKIDVINNRCGEHGQQIGELKGRLNGKN